MCIRDRLSDDKISFTLDERAYCVTFKGEDIGTEAICIEVCDAAGTCDTTKIVVEVVRIASLDTVNIEIVKGKTETFCLEQEILAGTFATITNSCDEASGLASEVILSDTSSCIDIAGIELGQDTACIIICDNIGNCDTTVFNISVRLPETDTVLFSLLIGQDTTYCMDLTELEGNLESFDTICGTPINATIQLNAITACIDIAPDSIGRDTICLSACDENGTCDTTIVFLNIEDMFDDLIPIAVQDDTITRKNEMIVLDILRNDTINGTLEDITIISTPQNGTVFLNPDQTVTYTPNMDFCGILRDTFDYVLVNEFGQDTATVSILTVCEDLTVISGFSPNGDNINDTFTIIGIEAFPNSEVTVFNRWGNEVFSQKGYTNDKGWGGTFDGNNLPDGTYFYVIDKGDNSSPLSGYVYIRR